MANPVADACTSLYPLWAFRLGLASKTVVLQITTWCLTTFLLPVTCGLFLALRAVCLWPLPLRLFLWSLGTSAWAPCSEAFAEALQQGDLDHAWTLLSDAAEDLLLDPERPAGGAARRSMVLEPKPRPPQSTND